MWVGRTGRVCFLAALVLGACSENGTAPPEPEIGEVGVVVASSDVSLTIFDVEDPAETRTVGLAPDGSPVSLAVRGDLAAIPLGNVPALAVVDLGTAILLRTVALPEGSGATGVAFLNDSIVLVANPSLNSVTPVNVLAGTRGADISVGRFPQAIVVHEGRAFVLNAELEQFVPDGPATITVIDVEELQVTASVVLSGENASAGAVGPDGLLYVIQSGSFGAANGSLSVVDLADLTEVAHHEGFGDFPGSIVFGPTGDVYIGAFSFGVVVWDPVLAEFRRGPVDNPIAPGGIGSVSGVGFDEMGRLYTLTPECGNPSTANRLDHAYEIEVAIPVGICPFAIGFTHVEGAR